MEMRQSEGLAETASIRKALLDYCGLDTLAIMKILEKMRKMMDQAGHKTIEERHE